MRFFATVSVATFWLQVAHSDRPTGFTREYFSVCQLSSKLSSFRYNPPPSTLITKVSHRLQLLFEPLRVFVDALPSVCLSRFHSECGKHNYSITLSTFAKKVSNLVSLHL